MLLKRLIKRLFYSAVVLFLLITLIFFLLRIAPGSPSDKFASPKFSKELKHLAEEKFGIDKPVYIQYGKFIANLAAGDFGISYTYNMPVKDVALRFLPFTAIFSTVTLLIQVLTAYFLVIWTAGRPGSSMDKILSRTSITVYTLPSFFLGVILIYIFSVQLKILPSSGISSFDAETMSVWERFWDLIWHMVLPALTLSAAGGAMFYKYLREEVKSVSKKPFVDYLRANGFNENVIFRKHIIPNAAGPLISAAGVEFGVLLGGAVITEVIFGLPGMGRLTLDAVLSRDYPLVIGCTIISGIMVIAANLTADLFRARLDPRQLNEGIVS